GGVARRVERDVAAEQADKKKVRIRIALDLTVNDNFLRRPEVARDRFERRQVLFRHVNSQIGELRFFRRRRMPDGTFIPVRFPVANAIAPVIDPHADDLPDHRALDFLERGNVVSLNAAPAGRIEALSRQGADYAEETQQDDKNYFHRIDWSLGLLCRGRSDRLAGET